MAVTGNKTYKIVTQRSSRVVINIVVVVALPGLATLKLDVMASRQGEEEV